MAFPGEYLVGYGLAPEFGSDEGFYPRESDTDLLPIGCNKSLISLELGQCLIHASRNLPYRSDAPLELPRGDSIVWLRKALLSPACINNYREWIGCIDPCESPIEAVAFLGLCVSLSLAEIPLLIAKPNGIPALPLLEDRMVVAQVVLQEPADRYRIDAALHFNCRLGNKFYRHNLAIECDGLEYHSSPLQIAHDNAKDKDLAAMGFSVHRFTGKDIWNNGRRCCQPIVRSLLNFCRQLIEGPLPEAVHQVESVHKAKNFASIAPNQTMD